MIQHLNPTIVKPLLPDVILSLGFIVEEKDAPISYVHTKHCVRLQKLFTGDTAFRFQIPHSLYGDVVAEWTRIKTVETEKEVKELFLVLWGTSL